MSPPAFFSYTGWLTVRWRVQTKLCCLMHSIFYRKCADYLSNIVRPVNLGRSRAGLRSSSTTNFAMPQQRTKCGKRAFPHAGPATWNALPEDMRTVPDFVVFRKRLKTHFLWPSCVADADIIFLPCGFFFLFSSPNPSRRRLDVYHTSFYTWTSTLGPHYQHACQLPLAACFRAHPVRIGDTVGSRKQRRTIDHGL